MADRKFYEPEGGEALDSDNNVFDVTEWRKNMVQERNGESHARTYDKTNNAIFQDLLDEIKALHTTIKLINKIEV